MCICGGTGACVLGKYDDGDAARTQALDGGVYLVAKETYLVAKETYLVANELKRSMKVSLHVS